MATVECNSVCGGSYFSLAKVCRRWRTKSMNLNLNRRVKRKSEFRGMHSICIINRPILFARMVFERYE